MNVTLENGHKVRGDLIISFVSRSDLVPIPETIEATFRKDSLISPLLKTGSTIKAGIDSDEYVIIWESMGGKDHLSQGSRGYGTQSIIAILKCVHKLSYALKRPVIKDNSSLGAVYRSCGATASISSDLSCSRFTCLAGDYATTHINRLLQEESASVLWNDGKLKFVRNTDIMKRKPIKRYEHDSSELVESGFLERHEIATYFSTDGGVGNLQAGDVSKVRKTAFQARTDQRILRNMTKVFVNKRVLDDTYNPKIKAGDTLDLAGIHQVVITAAHAANKGNQHSRLWLGELV